MDPVLHKHYTGVDNRRILENYVYLTQSKKPFITRIPLIPGVNDTVQNIAATARWLSELGVGEIQLLPYNKAAGAKYRLVGRAYEPDFDQAAEPDPHTECFEQYRIEVSIL